MCSIDTCGGGAVISLASMAHCGAWTSLVLVMLVFTVTTKLFDYEVKCTQSVMLRPHFLTGICYVMDDWSDIITFIVTWKLLVLVKYKAPGRITAQLPHRHIFLASAITRRSSISPGLNQWTIGAAGWLGVIKAPTPKPCLQSPRFMFKEALSMQFCGICPMPNALSCLEMQMQCVCKFITIAADVIIIMARRLYSNGRFWKYSLLTRKRFIVLIVIHYGSKITMFESNNKWYLCQKLAIVIKF